MRYLLFSLSKKHSKFSGFYRFKTNVKKILVSVGCHEHIPETVTERCSVKPTQTRKL